MVALVAFPEISYSGADGSYGDSEGSGVIVDCESGDGEVFVAVEEAQLAAAVVAIMVVVVVVNHW